MVETGDAAKVPGEAPSATESTRPTRSPDEVEALGAGDSLAVGVTGVVPIAKRFRSSSGSTREVAPVPVVPADELAVVVVAVCAELALHAGNACRECSALKLKNPCSRATLTVNLLSGAERVVSVNR